MSTLKYIADGNLMTVTLASNYTAGDGHMHLTAGHGARLPSAGDFWIRASIGTLRVWKVTARSGDDITVTPAQDGTSDGNLTAGAELKWVLGVAAFDQFRGDICQTGADAAKSPEKAGRLYLPSDGVYLRRDTGAAMAPWGPLFPFTEPIAAEFAWVNQGTASIDTTYGGLYFKGPAGTGVQNLIVLKKAVTAPYTVVAAFLPIVFNVTAMGVGLVFRQSSDGKLVEFRCAGDHNWGLNKWTNATNYSASYISVQGSAIGRAPCVWMRIQDDGANRICSLSVDGVHWYTYHTVSNTDFLTADEVGMSLYNYNATWGPEALFLHWLNV